MIEFAFGKAFLHFVMSLLIVGTVAFDTVETPYGRVERALGGSGSYAALAAAFFTKPMLVGVVGEDFPDEHLDFLNGRGVDTRGVARASGKTFFWHGKYEEDVNNRETLVTELNVLEGFDPVLPDDYIDAKYVFLANIDPVLQLKVLDLLPAAEFTIADTMNLWIDAAPETLAEVLKRVDAVLLNDSEARQLCGTPNLVKAARQVLERGPRAVIIKKGEHGVMLFTHDGVFALPAFPLEQVKDPTGAGDSFAGGLMGALCAGGRLDDAALRRALVVGTATASLCCEDFSVDAFRNASPARLKRRIEEIAGSFAVDMDSAAGLI